MTPDQALAEILGRHDAVKAFVAQSWDGQYVTRRARDLPGYNEVWQTILHGPSGPIVWTGVDHTGRLVDLTP